MIAVGFAAGWVPQGIAMGFVRPDVPANWVQAALLMIFGGVPVIWTAVAFSRRLSESNAAVTATVVELEAALEATRRTEQRIRAAERLKALSGLAGTIAHDLNNQVPGRLPNPYTHLAPRHEAVGGPHARREVAFRDADGRRGHGVPGGGREQRPRERDRGRRHQRPDRWQIRRIRYHEIHGAQRRLKVVHAVLAVSGHAQLHHARVHRRYRDESDADEHHENDDEHHTSLACPRDMLMCWSRAFGVHCIKLLAMVFLSATVVL